MNILHIISSGGMYGAEAVILNLSRSLNQDGHRSVLGVFSNTAQPNVQLHQIALAQGIESHLVPCNGQFDTTVPAAIRKLARQTSADIIHAHGYKADVYVYAGLRNSAVPLVSTCHTWYDNDLSVRLYGALDRFILRGFAGVVAVSDEVRRRLLQARVRPERVRLIRNGVDLSPFRSIPRPPETHRPVVVGLVGRLSQEKGVDLFLRAAAATLRELPETRFVVIGEGPDRPELEALLRDLNLGENVSLAGRCEDMPAAYASLDIMVSASRQEGLPVAILEGMASGLPLIATAVGAVPTIVRDGRTGVLLPPDNVDALKTAIVSLVRDPLRRLAHGAAGRQVIAEEFSADRMSAEYLELYRDVSQAARPGRDHTSQKLRNGS